jgi:hypothetical protein
MLLIDKKYCMAVKCNVIRNDCAAGIAAVQS